VLNDATLAEQADKWGKQKMEKEVVEELQAAQGKQDGTATCGSEWTRPCSTGDIRMTGTAYLYANWRVSTEKKNKWVE
jgi:hypothetical protein